MSLLQTTTISNQNLSSALLVGTYTANAERSALMCAVLANQIAGNGLYTVYATRQIGGAGAEYEYQPRTAVLVESGVTSIAFPSIIITALSGDVIKVYLLGLAGDTTTPDIICEFWDMLNNPSIATSVWNAAINSYNVRDTFGEVMHPLAHGQVGGATSTTVTLDGDAVGVNDYYDGALIQIGVGTGAGQSRIISTYVGATKIATVTDPWAVIPNGTSYYIIHPMGDVEVGVNNDKTGYALTTGERTSIAAAMWNALTSGITTANSIGKLIKDNLDATISSALTYMSVFLAKDADALAIKAKTDQLAFTIPNQVDANALTGGGGGGATAEEVWEYATRSLTQSAAQVAAIVEGDEITITNSATITIALTGLGSLTGATQIWFCAKRNKDADDESARFHVALDGGLLRTNGSAGVAGDGTLVVNNATTGNITVTVKPASAKLIAGGTGMHWGVKVKFSDDLVHELSSGVINIIQAITHSV